MLNEKFIKELFGENSMTIKEIKEKGNLQETSQKISGFLRQQDYIRSIGKRDNRLIYKVVPVDKAVNDIIREHYLHGNTHCKETQNDYYKHIESYDKNSKLEYVLKSGKYPIRR